MNRGPELSLGIFAINLDRSPDRWRSIVEQSGGLGWPVHRVAACDGRLDPAATLAVRSQTIRFPPSGVGINPIRQHVFSVVEEACFASHLVALRQFLASDLEFAIILEDDAILLESFKEGVEEILRSGQEFDVVKLEGWKQKGRRLGLRVCRLPSVSLVQSFGPASGAAAYLLSRSAAERLLLNAGRRCIPYDDYLNSSAFNGCHILQASPWLARQGGFPTTMGKVGRTRIKLRNPVSVTLMASHRAAQRLSLWMHASKGLFRRGRRLDFFRWT